MTKQPEWLNTAVFYEIYPQSFMDSNGDGIGDFNGIISKLDYIKELGCTAIWMNPCFDSPFGDAGYDVSDYKKAAPRYGTNADLKKLFKEAHKRNMHVLLDLVPGHTSVEHKWFKESMKAQKNEFTDRYIWTDSIWKEPTGYGSLRGISDRDGSCAVNFFSHQPALNYGLYAHFLIRNFHLQQWLVSGVNPINLCRVVFTWIFCFILDLLTTMIYSAAGSRIFPVVEKVM